MEWTFQDLVWIGLCHSTGRGITSKSTQKQRGVLHLWECKDLSTWSALGQVALGAICVTNLCIAWVNYNYVVEHVAILTISTSVLVLGFFHEHTRTDRDDYVTIEWDNIPQDWVHNFYKCDKRYGGCNDLNVGYDYGSIMHYGRMLMGKHLYNKHGHIGLLRSTPSIFWWCNTFFSGKTAIRSKRMGVSMGQRKRMSRLDIQGIKEYYECWWNPRIRI